MLSLSAANKDCINEALDDSDIEYIQGVLDESDDEECEIV